MFPNRTTWNRKRAGVLKKQFYAGFKLQPYYYPYCNILYGYSNYCTSGRYKRTISYTNYLYLHFFLTVSI